MGVIIESPHIDVMIGYGHFFQLRSDIASIAGNEIGRHYKDLNHLYPWGEKAILDAYDQETENIKNKYEKNHGKKSTQIFDFLYQSDVEGEITYECCEEILKLFDNCTDKHLTKTFKESRYGYIGGDTYSGNDFIEMLEDCSKAKKSLKWY